MELQTDIQTCCREPAPGLLTNVWLSCVSRWMGERAQCLPRLGLIFLFFLLWGALSIPAPRHRKKWLTKPRLFLHPSSLDTASIQL